MTEIREYTLKELRDIVCRYMLPSGYQPEVETLQGDSEDGEDELEYVVLRVTVRHGDGNGLDDKRGTRD